MRTSTVVEPDLSVEQLLAEAMADITRRQFGLGAAGFAALLLSGCGGDHDTGDSGVPPASGFTFADDEGVVIQLDRVPTRIAAWMSNAATLAEFGIKVTGAWGPPELARGVDLGGAESFGDEFLVNVEALAAANPELIVGNLFNGEFSLPQEEEFETVKAIAPVVRLEANGPVTEMIEAHERLSIALGADPDDPTIAAARTEFRAARKDLRAALTDKPRLKAVCLALMPDFVFVSYLNYAPLIDLAELGMDIHDNVEGDPAWDNGLSWELVPSLGADLIIWDDRPRFLQPQDLEDHPIWRSLPAVAAGQVVGYAFDAPLSYGFMGRQYRTIAQAVRAARTDLV